MSDATPKMMPTEPFSVPALVGRHVSLRTVMPHDYEVLRTAEGDPRLGQQWRLRGQTPSPESWNHMFWHGVLAQFLIVDSQSSDVLGLAMAYRADFQNGHAYVGAMKLDLDVFSPKVMLGLFRFIEYVFWTWPFRKLYFEAPEYNVQQFGTAIGRLLRIEARLTEHSYYGGRYWDELLLSLDRSTWNEKRRRLLAIDADSRSRRLIAGATNERA